MTLNKKKMVKGHLVLALNIFIFFDGEVHIYKENTNKPEVTSQKKKKEKKEGEDRWAGTYLYII